MPSNSCAASCASIRPTRARFAVAGLLWPAAERAPLLRFCTSESTAGAPAPRASSPGAACPPLPSTGSPGTASRPGSLSQATCWLAERATPPAEAACCTVTPHGFAACRPAAPCTIAGTSAAHRPPSAITVPRPVSMRDCVTTCWLAVAGISFPPPLRAARAAGARRLAPAPWLCSTLPLDAGARCEPRSFPAPASPMRWEDEARCPAGALPSAAPAPWLAGAAGSLPGRNRAQAAVPGEGSARADPPLKAGPRPCVGGPVGADLRPAPLDPPVTACPPDAAGVVASRPGRLAAAPDPDGALSVHRLGLAASARRARTPRSSAGTTWALQPELYGQATLSAQQRVLGGPLACSACSRT